MQTNIYEPVHPGRSCKTGLVVDTLYFLPKRKYTYYYKIIRVG